MSKLIITLAAMALFTLGIHAQTAKCKVFDKDGKPKCGGVKRWQDCPDKGTGGDQLLNRAKNRTDAAANPDLLKIIDIANFKHPKTWVSGTPRTKLVEWGEGRAIQVTLYLKDVKNYADGAESCNCNIDGDRNNDYHLVLTSRPNGSEKSSLTAEITPRLRDDKWTYKRLSDLKKVHAYVRVSGWAMLDTQHVGKATPIRKTHWEIHPATAFEVCTTTKTQCDAGTGWKKLEDMP